MTTRDPGGRLLICVLSLLGGGVGPSLAATAELSKEIERLAASSGLSGMRVGVRVDALAPVPELVYEQNATEQFKPASNQKILTTAAAMTLLPANFSYRTILGMRGQDLVVIGAGDPSIGDVQMARAEDQTITTVFERWAEELKKRGITEVRGNFLFDDFIFEQEFVNASWRKQFNLETYYAAPVGGLNYYDNCVAVKVRPGKPGEAAEVTVIPDAPFVRVDNRAKTGKGRTIIRLASKDPYTVAVSGSVGAATGGDGIQLAVTDPGAFFASACRKALEAQGIKFAGETKRERVRPEGSPLIPADLQVVAVHERKMHDVLWRVDKSSVNAFAEAVLKTIGAYAGRSDKPGVGSYETGRAAMVRFLEQLEVPENSYVIDDGSGLSHSNRVTPRLISAILRFMDAHAEREEFRSNLAVPGEAEGTLRRRMKELKGKVLAKTGYINGVSALSGYVDGPGDRRYAFSVLCNDIHKAKGGLGAARKFEDDLCRLLARWGSDAEKAKPAPATAARSGDARSATKGR